MASKELGAYTAVYEMCAGIKEQICDLQEQLVELNDVAEVDKHNYEEALSTWRIGSIERISAIKRLQEQLIKYDLGPVDQHETDKMAAQQHRIDTANASEKAALNRVRQIRSSWQEDSSRLTTQLCAARIAIQFVVDKCVSRCAGGLPNQFAYLWQKDWDEFLRILEDPVLDLRFQKDGRVINPSEHKSPKTTEHSVRTETEIMVAKMLNCDESALPEALMDRLNRIGSLLERAGCEWKLLSPGIIAAVAVSWQQEQNND